MLLHQSLIAFNGGELSPYLRYRNDFAKHLTGAAWLENFIPLAFGSLTKRPGTLWRVETELGGLNSKAFGFTSSEGADYVLHFTVGKLTVYRKDGTVADSLDFLPNYDWAGVTTWETGIRGLKMEQVNDVAFLTHPLMHPLQLSSLSDTNWELKFIPFTQAPTIDENLDKTKTFTVASNPVAPTWASGAGYVGGSKVFTNCEWLCLLPHTAAAANKPGSGSDWKSYWQRMFYVKGDSITLLSDERSEVAWDVGFATYQPGDWVRTYTGSSGDLYIEYYAFKAYTAKETDTINLSSSAFWEIFPWQFFPWVYDDLQLWSGKLVIRFGVVYKLIAAHTQSYEEVTPGLGTHPGEGTLWRNFWLEIGTPPNFSEFRLFTIYNGAYAETSRVSNRGRVFVCTDSHVPIPATEPGVGAAWQAYWSEVSRMVDSFDADEYGPGNYYRLSPERDDSDFQSELAATSGNNGKSSPIIAVQGGWNFFTYGKWNGTWTLERSANQGKSWESVRSWEGKADRNVADTGEEAEAVWLRLRWKHGADGSLDPRAVLVPQSPSVTGYGLMDTYVGPSEMTGKAVTSLMSGNTYRWAEGAFNSRYGYPRALALHGFRLWFAGTRANPVSLWASKINDFLNSEPLTDDDAGFFRTLATSNHTPIVWLASSRRLFIGTTVGEWVEGSETTDLAVTPTNAQFREYTPKGSCVHQPLKMHDGVIFLGQNGTRLYELGSSESNSTFQVMDLSRYAEHLLKDGLTGMAFQKQRLSVLWCVTVDGDLRSLSYSKEDSVLAWARHSTESGLFRDVVVFYSDLGEDEVFFLIDRNGSTNLERLPNDWQAGFENGGVSELDAWNYLDAAGMEGGNFSVHSWFVSLPIDLQVNDGTTQGRLKRANECLLNVFQSYGGGVAYTSEIMPVDWSSPRAPFDSEITTSGDLRSGWVATTLPPDYVDDLHLQIVHEEPYPFTVRGCVLRWQLHES